VRYIAVAEADPGGVDIAYLILWPVDWTAQSARQVAP